MRIADDSRQGGGFHVDYGAIGEKNWIVRTNSKDPISSAF
jgi:hypothetical protein